MLVKNDRIEKNIKLVLSLICEIMLVRAKQEFIYLPEPNTWRSMNSNNTHSI